MTTPGVVYEFSVDPRSASSDVLFAGGGLLAALGLVLAVRKPPQPRSTAQQAARLGARRLSLGHRVGIAGLLLVGSGLVLAAVIDTQTHPYGPAQPLIRFDASPATVHNGVKVDTAAVPTPTGKLVRLRVSNNRSPSTDLALLAGGLLIGAGLGAALTGSRGAANPDRNDHELALV